MCHYVPQSPCAKWGLTLRSSGAPTAWRTGHQALGLRPILRLLSSAPRRRCPLSSNVRPRRQPSRACAGSQKAEGRRQKAERRTQMRASIMISVSLKANETQGHAMPEGTANKKAGTGFTRAIWVSAARFDQRLRPTTAGKPVGGQGRSQRQPSSQKCQCLRRANRPALSRAF